MAKYKNKKTVVDNITFASEKEAERYIELNLLQRAGKISNLQLQVPYELIPPCKLPNPIGRKKTERRVKYYADFVYQKDGKTVVEDTKGQRTKDYIIKRKLMLWVHGISIKET